MNASHKQSEDEMNFVGRGETDSLAFRTLAPFNRRDVESTAPQVHGLTKEIGMVNLHKSVVSVEGQLVAHSFIYGALDFVFFFFA